MKNRCSQYLRKRILPLAVLILMGVAIMNQALGGVGEKAAMIPVDPTVRFQAIKGWGSSLCWWGNIIGAWGDQDFNGNGRPDREEVAELAFSPEYLNLNIVRYNVGGGDDPTHTHLKRIEGAVPGWTKDMSASGSSDGGFDGADIDYDEKAFMAKTTAGMADSGQIWMWEQANMYRDRLAKETGAQNDIVNIVFSNSPPYYLTDSGCASGNKNGASNLTDPDKQAAFALYLARAVKWLGNDLNRLGVGNARIDAVDPMNEPNTSYWQMGSTKQEGCAFTTPQLQNDMLQKTRAALDSLGLKDVRLTASDETALSTAIKSYESLTTENRREILAISAHTYSADDMKRRALRDLAQSGDKELWMSEVSFGGGPHDLTSLDKGAQDLANGILNDLKTMQAGAWVAWIVTDSEYEALQTSSQWGLLHAVFEPSGQPVAGYHTNLMENGQVKPEVSGVQLPAQGFHATRQFYVMMQYSRFIKAGYRLIDIGDKNMVAALSPEGRELVIVANNLGDRRDIAIDVSALPKAARAAVYLTDAAHGCELAEDLTVTDGALKAALPEKSVTTFVVKGENGKALFEDTGYGILVNAEVQYDPEASRNAVNKFNCTQGAWSVNNTKTVMKNGNLYSTSKGASISFETDGNRVILYGPSQKSGGSFRVSVDGAEAGVYSNKSSGLVPGVILYDTGNLGEGSHTVTLTSAGGRLEVDYARVIYGNVKIKE